MELSAVQAIQNAYPGSQVTILSPFPEMDRPFYAPIPVEYCNRRRLILATLDLARGVLWRVAGKEWLLSAGLKRTRDADLVIDLSGDMLTDDYGPHVAYSHYIPLLRAIIVGKPFFICAQSIGPFTLTRLLARFILQRAAAITARDHLSLDYLQAIGLGLANDRIEQTADLAFLLAPAEGSRAAAILEQEGIALDGRPLLGISLSQLIEDQFKKHNPAARNQDFIGLLKAALQQVAQTRDIQILLIAHVTGPSDHKNDRLIANRMHDAIGSNITAFVLQGDYRPEELKAIIAKCTVFCGSRMHANMGALSMHVPTVAISYSHKAPGIMQSCGVGEFVDAIASLTAESLALMIEQAFAEHSGITARLHDEIPKVRAMAKRNIDKLAELALPMAPPLTAQHAAGPSQPKA